MPYISEVVQRLACIALGLCAGEPTPFQPAIAQTPSTGQQFIEYRFGVEPMSVTRNLWRRYHPLIREINDAASGYRLRIASGLTTDAYERKLSEEAFDLVIVEPHRVLQAEQRNYIVFARAGNQDRIGGVIVVRTDAHIQKLRDLRGKTICFGARNALASTLMPRMWLREANFPESAADLLFTGSDETALFRVSRGLAQAAAVSRDAWQRFVADNPDAGSSMSIRWSTNELSGPAIMAHRRVLAAHRDQVTDILAHLDQTERGRAALRASGIRSLRRGDDASYDDVWEFLTSYSRVFGYSAPGVLQ